MYNGSGSFTLPVPAFVAGTTISVTSVNADFTDISLNGLSKCVVVDGQSTILAPLKFPSGTATAPSHTFNSDLTTGMYFIGAKHLGFAAGGVQAVGFNTNNFGSGQSGNVLEVNTPTGVVYPFPVGAVIDYAAPVTSPPGGWLLCFGQILNISSYPELFANISNTYGGDGVSTFGIPDCRGRATYGKDNMGGSAASRITVAGLNFDGTVLGGTGGAQSHVLTVPEFPSHTHTGSGNVSDPGHIHSVNNPNVIQAGASGSNLGNTNGTTVNITMNSNTTGITVPSLNINNAGSSSAYTILDPGIIVNKIIFAGRT